MTIKLFLSFVYIFLYKEIIGSVTDTGRYYYMGLRYRSEILSGSLDILNFDWADSTAVVSFIAGLISLITPSNYLCISFIFTALGFIGSWLVFKTFISIYPANKKHAAVAAIFTPSVLFWGSSLMKDPLAFLSLGMMYYYGYNLFVAKRYTIKYFILLVIGIILGFLIKAYIPICFIPVLVIWIISEKLSAIKYAATKLIVYPLLLSFLIVAGYWGMNTINDFAMESMTEDENNLLTSMQNFYTNNPDAVGGSQYDIGTISPYPLENVKLVPAAINVSIFRPYPWEVKNFLYVPVTAEAIVSVVLVLWLLFNAKPLFIIRNILHDKHLLATLLFVLLFGALVGISSFNFGSLMRYKIPMLPFWFFLLYRMLHLYNEHNRRKKMATT